MIEDRGAQHTAEMRSALAPVETRPAERTAPAIQRIDVDAGA